MLSSRSINRSKRHSRAFTLLEVMLAMSIGVVLLAALYVAVDTHLHHAQIAREVVEESTLTRALLDRMAVDIKQSIAPMRPASSASSAAGGSGSSNSGTASPPATGASSTPTMSSTNQAASTNAVVFNLGLQGDNQHLLLSTSRVPREVGTAAAPTGQLVSDLRRIVYWFQGTGQGLARQEVQQATSDDASAGLTALPEDSSYVIAPEVADLNFSFFDGSAWQDSWDSTQPGADGVTPMGPPVAVAIELTVTSPDKLSKKKTRRVVVIPTANGIPQQGSAGAP